jgi:hypothetical protein
MIFASLLNLFIFSAAFIERRCQTDASITTLAVQFSNIRR